MEHVRHLSLGPARFRRQRHPDLVARKPDGTLWLYSEPARGCPGRPGRSISAGAFSTVVAIQDFNGDGTNDLIGRKPDGTLWYYANTGAARLVNGAADRHRLGIYGDIVGAGDAIQGRHAADIGGATVERFVYFYAGTGTAGGGYLAPRQIGASAGKRSTCSSTSTTSTATAKERPGRPQTRWDPVVSTPAQAPVGTVHQQRLGTSVGRFQMPWSGSVTSTATVKRPGRPQTDGSLWLYPGRSGRRDQQRLPSGGEDWELRLEHLRHAGSVGDFNGDAQTTTGRPQTRCSLWLYPGTGGRSTRPAAATFRR